MNLPRLDTLDWKLVGRRAASLLGTLLLMALIVPFLIYAAPGVAGAEGSYVVLSGSMAPTIEAGDVVFVYATDPMTIQEGDVITYKKGGEKIPITHRVTEVIVTDDVDSGVVFQTMGDANEDADAAMVPGSAIIGVVPTLTLPYWGATILRIPAMGHVILYANTNPGFALLVGLPLAAFILNEIWNVARAGRRETVAEPDTETDVRSDDGIVETAQTQPTATEPVESSDEGSFEVDQTDLQVTLAVLALFSAYAIWVAYTLFNAWSTSVAVGAVGTTLYIAALRHRALASRSESPAETRASVTDGGLDSSIETGSDPVAPETGNEGSAFPPKSADEVTPDRNGPEYEDLPDPTQPVIEPATPFVRADIESSRPDDTGSDHDE